MLETEPQLSDWKLYYVSCHSRFAKTCKQGTLRNCQRLSQRRSSWSENFGRWSSLPVSKLERFNDELERAVPIAIRNPRSTGVTLAASLRTIIARGNAQARLCNRNSCSISPFVTFAISFRFFMVILRTAGSTSSRNCGRLFPHVVSVLLSEGSVHFLSFDRWTKRSVPRWGYCSPMVLIRCVFHAVGGRRWIER